MSASVPSYPMYLHVMHKDNLFFLYIVSTCIAHIRSEILIAGKMKIIFIEYKPTKCTFSKLIFKFLIFLCLLHVSNQKVHLQEGVCIYRYGIVCFICRGVSSVVERRVHFVSLCCIIILQFTVQKTEGYCLLR